jgi:hypothetical protein
MKANRFDAKFDAGDDVTAHLDLAAARRPSQDARRVNVDFPAWMVKSLDDEAKRLGVTRQSIIKVWIAERLERLLTARRGFRDIESPALPSAVAEERTTWR